MIPLEFGEIGFVSSFLVGEGCELLNPSLTRVVFLGRLTLAHTRGSVFDALGYHGQGPRLSWAANDWLRVEPGTMPIRHRGFPFAGETAERAAGLSQKTAWATVW